MLFELTIKNMPFFYFFNRNKESSIAHASQETLWLRKIILELGCS